MKHLLFKTCLLPATVVIALAGSVNAADCYADYKAKRNTSQAGDLKLHYGVIELSGSPCAGANQAENTISNRIGRDGWILLRVVSIFGANELSQRRANAGNFYLRY